MPDFPSGVGGSIPTPPLHFDKHQVSIEIRVVPFELAAEFTLQHHYSKVMPKQTKLCFGFYRGRELIGIITLGWGVRPRDTIRRLFPSLDSKDYFEIGKFCVSDAEPKNTESHLLSLVIRWLKTNRKDIKVLFTWADALWGKPGYIYQAANFYYGGSITTDLYADANGTRFHPRQLRAKLKAEGVFEEELRQFWKADNEIGVCRPSKEQLQQRGWKHYFGLQFRYVYFLCDRENEQRLIKESAESKSLIYDVVKHLGRKHECFEQENGDVIHRVIKKPSIIWVRKGYPKYNDIWWKVDDGRGINGKSSKPVKCTQPRFGSAFDPNRI